MSATARAILAGGLLPGVAPGAGLGVVVRAPRPIIHPTIGMVLLPEKVTADDAYAFGLTAGWLGACGSVLDRPRITLDLCGTVLMGDLHAVVRTADVRPDEPGDRFWMGLSPSTAARIRFGAFTVEAGAELIVPLLRSPFAVRGGSGEVFQQSPVGGLGFLGVGLSTRRGTAP